MKDEGAGGQSGRSFPWLAALFLGIMLLSLAWALAAARWTPGLHVLAWAVLAGWGIGSMLAYVRWPRWFVHLYKIVVGAALTLHLCSTLISPSLTGIQRDIEVIARLLLWARTVIQGSQSSDSLIFVADVTFLLWWLSVSATEHLIRARRVWGVILTVGALHFLNAHYAPTDLTGFVILYLASALLLLVGHHLDEQIRRWELTRVGYSPDVVMDYLRYGALLTTILLFLAWTLPPFNARAAVDRWFAPTQRPWHTLQEEWTRMFGALRSGAPVQTMPVFARGFDFQGAPHLYDTPYFRVHAARGRYWRSAVYDVYRGNGWDSTLGTEHTLPAGTSLPDPGRKHTQVLTQTITPLQEGMVSLIAAPNPVQFSIPVQTYLFDAPDGAQEILLAYARHPLRRGESYTVRSVISLATAEELRRARGEYPSWLYQHFTQLPDTLPHRVVDLARALTSGLETPYDRVRALEQYLRTLSYNEDIPAPPPSVDAVDWFLFQQREGYCDYYASALVVMARSLGIPARIASGYARGLYDPQTHTWVVRESDAHSWPEIWFPGYGWIPFEPTPAEPPLDRGERSSSFEEDIPLWERERLERERNIPEDVALPTPTGEREGENRGEIPRGLVFTILLGLLLLFGYGGYRWRARKHSSLPVTELYRELVRWARRLGVPLSPAWTPREVGDALSQRLPAVREWVQAVVEVYQTRLYAAEGFSQPVQGKALAESWPRVRLRLVTAWLRENFRRAYRWVLTRVSALPEPW